MPTKPPQPAHPVLSLRELNRATLARQMLLAPEQMNVVEAVEKLAGLQAQYSPSPYIALWTRLKDFRHEELTEALVDRTIIKASLMRWTLHLASARDFPALTTAIGDARSAVWGKIITDSGLDMPGLHNKLLAYTRKEPRTHEEMYRFLEAHVPPDPDRTERALWHMASAKGWLMHVPPSGTWRYFGKNSYISAYTWLDIKSGQEPTLEDAILHLVRRYLAAFGPATRADVVQWAGLRRISHVDRALRQLGDEVALFQNEQGNILYDLVAAPRPGGDVSAPVRFLPKWDNLLLAYSDRSRVLPDAYRKVIIKVNGDVAPTFLVDGVVAGVWSSKLVRSTAEVTLEPFTSLTAQTRASLEEEAIRLAQFVEPEANDYAVEFV